MLVEGAARVSICSSETSGRRERANRGVLTQARQESPSTGIGLGYARLPILTLILRRPEEDPHPRPTVGDSPQTVLRKKARPSCSEIPVEAWRSDQHEAKAKNDGGGGQDDS